MANQIEREVWVKQDKLKNPIHYVRGTDLLPIVFHFRDFTIPSGATARVFVAKPDGNAVYDSATIEGNDVAIDVTEQMFLVLGMTLMQISIFDDEEELVTFAQPVMVEQNLKAGDLPESTTDVSFLDDAIEQANQAVNTATTAASQAAKAVQNANQAIADANEAISDLNEQIASLNTNFATLSNSVSISQLQTMAKTLVGAVNELNGNSYLLQGGTEIPKNADMNGYKTLGNYYCKLSDNVITLANAPDFTTAFIMKVEFGSGNNYPTQIYVELTSGRVARRFFDYIRESWSQYVYFSDDATLQLKMIPSQLKTLSDVLVYAESMQYPKVEFFSCSGSEYTGNFPNNQYNFGTGFILKRNAVSMSVIAFSESSQYRPIINSIKRGSWEGWKYFDGTSANL